MTRSEPHAGICLTKRPIGPAQAIILQREHDHWLGVRCKACGVRPKTLGDLCHECDERWAF